MYQILQYFKFLFTSTNQHGVHSPFVYTLVTQCFYNKNNHEAYASLTSYRNSWRTRKDKVTITDFGAGSKRFDSKPRAVNAIAKTSGTPPERAKLLFRLVNYLKPKHLLELGTSLGIATQSMALGNENGTVTSIEGCPTISALAKQQLDRFQIKNILLKTGPFEDYLPVLKQQQWDLIFFDGNHQKAPTLQYFEALLTTATNDSVFIFDDIYWSKDMTVAWAIIKQHPEVSITIDTFFWGLVFFRKELHKENFKIRV